MSEKRRMMSVLWLGLLVLASIVFIIVAVVFRLPVLFLLGLFDLGFSLPYLRKEIVFFRNRM